MSSAACTVLAMTVEPVVSVVVGTGGNGGTGTVRTVAGTRAHRPGHCNPTVPL